MGEPHRRIPMVSGTPHDDQEDARDHEQLFASETLSHPVAIQGRKFWIAGEYARQFCAKMGTSLSLGDAFRVRWCDQPAVSTCIVEIERVEGEIVRIVLATPPEYAEHLLHPAKVLGPEDWSR